MENRTNIHMPKIAERPSKLGTFLRGFGSGASNSAIMLGIFAGVGFIFGLPAMVLPVLGATVLTTGIFSGIMGLKKASSEDEPVKVTHLKATPAKTHEVHQAQAPAVEQSVSASNDIRSDWAERVGNRSNSQSRIQEIVANGSMSDKDRARAILAEREQSATSSPSL